MNVYDRIIVGVLALAVVGVIWCVEETVRAVLR